VTANQSVTLSTIRTQLAKCGYRKSLLQNDYSYSGQSVPLAAFAYESCDARNACIAVIDEPESNEPAIQKNVDKKRILGAPIVFVCRPTEIQWWVLKHPGTECLKKVSLSQIPRFFDDHQKDFLPEKIYRAKTIARLDSRYQLKFVDIGLLPVIEQDIGEQTADLIGRMISAAHKKLGKPTIGPSLGRWLFQSILWLFAGKILKDKEVPSFSKLDINNVQDTLSLVQRHYSAEIPSKTVSRSKLKALQAASEILNPFGSLKSLSIEALAYVYENSLVDKDVRKALGIHATPSYLVDYIVWQLAHQIDQIPEDERVVLEPTCGHAPFLISSLRLLRELSTSTDTKSRHHYLKSHLVGLECDSFASEIARLSLTLADIPNPNGWNLRNKDVFRDSSLSEHAKKATILLCNPPFEDFEPQAKTDYEREGKIQYYNKAAEVLARTMPYMPNGSVFGVVLPQGFLDRKNLAPLRKMILEEWELSEIILLPENVFTVGKHKSTVLLGRKTKAHHKIKGIKYSRIDSWNLNEFIERYKSDEERVDQNNLSSATYDLWVPLLNEVWEYLKKHPCLSQYTDVGQGFVHKGGKLPSGSETFSKHHFKGAIRGFVCFDSDLKITDVPAKYWVNLDAKVIRRPQWGTQKRIPQILLNYNRVSHGPWRLKALIDHKGHPVTSNFLVIRPKIQEWSLLALWAILNSPLTNAYAYCHSIERHNSAGTVRNIPIPDVQSKDLINLENAAQSYWDLVSEPEGEFRLRGGINLGEARKQMFALDAEVLRLYDLPPRLERRLLDFFAEWDRPGVHFKFERYFPPDFDAWIPLHEYLSEEFQRSTPAYAKQWVEEVRSPELVKALNRAEEDFKGE
jgi:hypothetical protein